MKVAQITKYNQKIDVKLHQAETPVIQANEVLIKTAYAAVNPLDLLNINGSVKLIQGYPMPLTLGNELTGVIEQVGAQVTDFKVGDAVYTRLPLNAIGAFAEYVAVAADAIWYLPKNLNLKTAAAVALTGLTAYQGLTEILHAQAGESLLIPGGSGSFGQMAVPIAKSLGLKVTVTGNQRAKQSILSLGADTYLDYREVNYWTQNVQYDYVIDTLGANEITHELSVIKPGGQLLSLKAGPNKQFAIRTGLPKWKTVLFGAAGAKIDKQAQQHDARYQFIFVRASGAQLKAINQIVEANHIVPPIEPTMYTLDEVKAALVKVDSGHPAGKVLLRFQ